jgi:hypothetical protein
MRDLLLRDLPKQDQIVDWCRIAGGRAQARIPAERRAWLARNRFNGHERIGTLLFVGGGAEKAFLAARMFCARLHWPDSQVKLLDLPRAVAGETPADTLAGVLRQVALGAGVDGVVLLDDGGYGSLFPAITDALRASGFSGVIQEQLLCSLGDKEGFNRILGESAGEGVAGKAVAAMKRGGARNRTLLGYQSGEGRVIPDYFVYRQLGRYLADEFDYSRLFFCDEGNRWLQHHHVRWQQYGEPAAVDGYSVLCAFADLYIESFRYTAEIEILRRLVNMSLASDG